MFLCPTARLFAELFELVHCRLSLFAADFVSEPWCLRSQSIHDRTYSYLCIGNRFAGLGRHQFSHAFSGVRQQSSGCHRPDS